MALRSSAPPPPGAPSLPEDNAFAHAPEGVPYFEGGQPERPRRERPIRETFTIPSRRRPGVVEEEEEGPEGPRDEGPDLDVDDLVRRFRVARRPGTDGMFYPGGIPFEVASVYTSFL